MSEVEWMYMYVIEREWRIDKARANEHNVGTLISCFSYLLLWEIAKSIEFDIHGWYVCTLFFGQQIKNKDKKTER